jgi:hypothetical protein
VFEIVGVDGQKVEAGGHGLEAEARGQVARPIAHFADLRKRKTRREKVRHKPLCNLSFENMQFTKASWELLEI